MELKNYLKYYFLENYLFGEVHDNFQKNGYLNAEEFFAIIIWKRAASKTKIKDQLILSGKTIEGITSDIFKNKNDRRKQLDLLADIKQVGISIASAVLTVCYPDEFTIVDVRACASLKREFHIPDYFPYDKYFTSKDNKTRNLYLAYVNKCKELRKQTEFNLRNFDRVLFGQDLYNDEKSGLRILVDKYNRKEMELKKKKSE